MFVSLFSQAALKDVYDINNSQLGHELSTLVNDDVISSFHKVSFIFVRRLNWEVFPKQNMSEKF